MKIKLLVPRAVIGDPQRAGDVIEVSTDDATRMIKAGQAEPYRNAIAPEKSVRGRKAERAAK